MPGLPVIRKPRLLIKPRALAILSLFPICTGLPEDVAHDRTMKFDLAVRGSIHSHASPSLTKAMMVISFIGGDGLAIAALLAEGLFIWFRWRRAALWLITTIAGAIVLSVSLKHAFHRPRPVAFFGALPHGSSFPSGHSLLSFCFYGGVGWLARLPHCTIHVGFRILIWLCAAALVRSHRLFANLSGRPLSKRRDRGIYLTAAVWVSTMVTLDRLRLLRKDKSLTIEEP